MNNMSGMIMNKLHVILYYFWILTLAIMCPLILLNRWDTAGADRFKGVTTAYFRGAQGEMDNIAEFCLVGGGGELFLQNSQLLPQNF